MVNHDSSGSGYGESTEDTERPAYTHDEDDRVIRGTVEDKFI